MSDAFAEFDDGVPNVARIYDYALGGSHNFAVDRERGDQIMAANPDLVATARANRAFLRHAVEHAVGLGIRQFLDLGSGIPTVGNVHEVAHQLDPAIRVAYVDNEAVAVAHSTAILAEVATATITAADLRDPDAVLSAPGVVGLLDFSRPVAVFTLAALHFVLDEQDPATVLRGYGRALPAGSLLALSHASADHPDHPDVERSMLAVEALYSSTSNPVRLRAREEIRAVVLAAGFVPDGEGLVELSRWARPRRDRPLGVYSLISEPLGG